ncbi:MAG: sugar kinase [Verrucomicrobiales bacterium]
MNSLPHPPTPALHPRVKTERKCQRAFAPANGSLIFETYEAGPSHGRGSLGVGFTLEAGVVAEVSRLKDGSDSQRGGEAGRSKILVAGEDWEFPTVREVVGRLACEPVVLRLMADLPFGCGFGMSGASALASAYALGALFEDGRSLRELGLIAHEAEVAHATGRGDVGGQFNGGFMVKTKVGAPLDVEWLPIPESPVWCRIFGPISTREVLRDAAVMARVNAAGRTALAHLRAHPAPSLDKLLALSRTFAEDSGLLTSSNVRAAIDEALASGGQASMVMLGEAVVSSVPITGATRHRVVRRPAHRLTPGSV